MISDRALRFPETPYLDTCLIDGEKPGDTAISIRVPKRGDSSNYTSQPAKSVGHISKKRLT